MKLGIIGGRDLQGVLYENRRYVYECLDLVISQNSVHAFVTGGGRGVEHMVMAYAEAHGLPVRTMPPNIAALGPEKAFSLRNSKIVAAADLMLFFSDGSISNVADAVSLTTVSKKRAIVYPMI